MRNKLYLLLSYRGVFTLSLLVFHVFLFGQIPSGESNNIGFYGHDLTIESISMERPQFQESEGLNIPGTIFINPLDPKKIKKSKGAINAAALKGGFQFTRFYTNDATIDYKSVDKIFDGKTKPQELFEMGLLKEEQNGKEVVRFYTFPEEKIKQFHRPFYFKKHEVTNQEYRDFMAYVIANTASKEDLFKKDEDRLLIIPEKLVYHFEDEKGSTQSIQIYPDSLCWEIDFGYSYNEPMRRNYLSHPAYEDYPVVGVNYFQAKAFCHWKSQELSKQLGKKVIVQLPTEVEWEWVSTTICEDCHYSESLQDHSWKTDLGFTYGSEEKDIFKLRRLAETDARSHHNLVSDGFLYTNPADLNHKSIKDQKKNYEKNKHCCAAFMNLDFQNISGMGNNVSEWMDNSYSAWEPSFLYQIDLLNQENTPTSNLVKETLLYYDSFCDKDGYLVRGANWADERFSLIQGKNKAGNNAKTFLSPQKAHATVGFRYVVHVEE